MPLLSSQLILYTGKLLEEEFFPECIETALSEKTGYIPYRGAMLIARNSQSLGWNPTDPYPRMANDLHAYVCEELGEDDFSRVRMYSVVGTALDRFHGIDGWFEYQGEKQQLILQLMFTKRMGIKQMLLFTLKTEMAN